MVAGHPAPPRPKTSPPTNPAAAGIATEVLADLSAVLTRVRHVLGVVNSGLAMNEAVHGLRMLEPRNDLSQEMKELAWCVALLNGQTELACPPGDNLIEAPAGQRRAETPLADHQDELNRQGTLP